MTNLNEIKLYYQNALSNMTNFEKSYFEKRKGPAYHQRYAQLERTIIHWKTQAENLGKKHLVVECIFDLPGDFEIGYEIGIKYDSVQMVKGQQMFIKHKITYSGIISEDAIQLILLCYPKAININATPIIPGSLQKIG